MDIKEIVRLLRLRAESLVRELLPRGFKDGPEWRVGSVEGEPGKSMAVHIGQDPRTGAWKDFATGEVGDLLDLIAAVHFRGEKKQALAWSRAWLGLDGADSSTLAKARQQAARAAAKQKRQGDGDRDQRRRSALALWLSARESIRDTPVDAYLLGRNIDLRRLGRQPRVLRYHPELRHPQDKCCYPAMVAAIVDGAGKTVAVHRTFLTRNPAGQWVKVNDKSLPAPLREAKLTLGTYKGGSIRLWRGGSGKPMSRAPEGEEVAAAEGIEDALTVAIARPALRVVSAVSLANLANVIFPPQIRSVLICADNDAAGSGGAAGLDRAVRAQLAAGKAVRLARAPRGVAKDFNELANQGVA